MSKKREDYSEEIKWNVKDLYKTEEEYNKAYKNLENDIKKYESFKGHILDNAHSLYEVLKFDVEVSRNIEQIYIYAHIQNDQDTANTKFQKMYGEAYNLYSKYVEATSFIVPEILKSNLDVIDKYIKEDKRLEEYKRYIYEMFKFKDHTLSDKEELLISSLKPTFSTPDDVYSVLTDADMKFGNIINEEGKKEELTEKLYHKLIKSSNRKVRKKTFDQLLGTYGNFKNTYAALLGAEVKKNNKLALVRNYSSALEASLYGNDIPINIYTNLINTVKKNISPLSRFWKLKKEALGVSKLHIYDTYAPIVQKIDKKYSIEEAKDLLFKSLSVLGEEYIKDLTRSFDEGWIDFPPNDNKRNGAYCTACYNVHPYVLLSFDGTYENVSTLAHELGHAMHYYYAIKNQNYQDYGYSIFVAEVASQVNQILLTKYLINNTDDKEFKKYLIDDLIADFKASLYRQTMFADFEKTIHDMDKNGEVLTHDAMCDAYYKLNKEYYGKNIVVDDLIKYEWERIPHFYMNFYVYQYATAYAASIKIANDLLNGVKGTREKYLEFLSLGCTKTPIDSLKIAGVDMSMQETYDEAFQYFDDLVNELENLFNE